MEAVSKQTDFLLENGVVFSSRFESGNLENVQIKEPNTVLQKAYSIIYGSRLTPTQLIAPGFTFQSRMFPLAQLLFFVWSI